MLTLSDLAGFAGLAVRIVGATLGYWKEQIFPMVHPLKGEIAVVTGGGMGIGRLVSLKLAKRGVTVVIWDLNEKLAQDTASEIKAMGGAAYAFKCDVSDRNVVYEVARKTKEQVGDVTILINNAGIVSGKPFLQTPDEMCIKTMEVNTMAHFWTTKAFLPSMMDNNHGYLVTVASMAGHVGVPRMADYCASKFGAVGFDESIRNELTKEGIDGVHTLCVCPNFINTGMFEGVSVRFPDLFPLLEPDYVAEKIVYHMQTHQPYLILPVMSYAAFFLKGFFPARIVDMVGEHLGLFDSMDDFKGRQKGLNGF